MYERPDTWSGPWKVRRKAVRIPAPISDQTCFSSLRSKHWRAQCRSASETFQPGGALLEGDGLPGDAVGVLLERGQLSVHGEIAWRSGMQCGMRFDAEISVDDWVKRVGHPGQQAVDRAVASLKKTESPSGEPAKRALPVAKFHSIKSICGALDATCERLASSEEMSVELAEEVLKLHGITQALRSMIK